jgi:hypothetical protein
MADDSDLQVANLIAIVNTHSAKHKGEFLKKIINATEMPMLWLGYLRNTVSRKMADRLLDATQASIIEAAGCLSLGLVRPAILSVRLQVELLLAFVYFNDHPVEWFRFERTGENYQLPSAVITYLNRYGDRYQERFRLLAAKKTRKIEDPYSVLSVHVHATSPYSAPPLGPLEALVRPATTCDECISLEEEVAEYVSDVLASWYTDRWHDLPKPITQKIKARLGSATLKEFCR